MNTSRTFIANWKMNFTFDQALTFARNNYDALVLEAGKPNRDIILAPSFETLSALTKIFAATPVTIAAQDCSSHALGSFTGQVSAASLKSLSCTSCIIGHSERRTHLHETDQEIAAKCSRLLDQSLNPILCIGETAHEHAAGQTLDVLSRQLDFLTERTHGTTQPLAAGATLLIAYEPVWAVGTGTVPSVDRLETVFSWLNKQVLTIEKRNRFKLLYGGSVNATTIKPIASIDQIDGYLVGGASLDFQEFEKLIHCGTNVKE